MAPARLLELAKSLSQLGSHPLKIFKNKLEITHKGVFYIFKLKIVLVFENKLLVVNAKNCK